MKSSGFPVHGRCELRPENDILMVDLYGPWNLECINEARTEAGPLIQQMLKAGPVGIVVNVHGTLAGTPDAIQSMRDQVELRKRDAVAAVAWVTDATVEAREVFTPVIEKVYDDLRLVRFFDNALAAQSWVGEMIKAARMKQVIGP